MPPGQYGSGYSEGARARSINVGGGELNDAEQFLSEQYRKLEEKLQDEAPSENEFEYVPKAERAEDIKLAERLGREFRWTGTERGPLLEKFLAIEIERSDWFEGAHAFKTTKFDDYTNGIDLVLEWEGEEETDEPTRLALDLTTSGTDEGLDKKLKKIWEMGRIKYFRSDVNDFEGSIRAPIVVLGVDQSQLGEIAKQAVAKKKVKERRGQYNEIIKETIVDPKAFADHPLKFLLLEQAKRQLDAQKELLIQKAARGGINLERQLAAVSAAQEVIFERWQNAQAELKTAPPSVRQSVDRLSGQSATHSRLSLTT